jgi:hypothetical protein
VPPASPAELRQRAVAKYQADRRDALLGFLAPSLICLVIWFALGPTSFFWPGLVIAGTGINLMSMVVRRENIIEENLRRLAKRQAKEQARELESRPPEDMSDPGKERRDDSTDEDGTSR